MQSVELLVYSLEFKPAFFLGDCTAIILVLDAIVHTWIETRLFDSWHMIYKYRMPFDKATFGMWKIQNGFLIFTSHTVLPLNLDPCYVSLHQHQTFMGLSFLEMSRQIMSGFLKKVVDTIFLSFAQLIVLESQTDMEPLKAIFISTPLSIDHLWA